MPNEFTCDKDILRRELKKRRAELADKPIRAMLATDRVCDLVRGNVLVYVSIGTELDTKPLIARLLSRSDVTVFAPYTIGGIVRAVPLATVSSADKLGNLPAECYATDPSTARNVDANIDFCITPMLGFNAEGYRIGYGKGCYDKLFARTNMRKVGLAFDSQLCEFEPDPHDIPLDCCVTETKVVYFDHACNIG